MCNFYFLHRCTRGDRPRDSSKSRCQRSSMWITYAMQYVLWSCSIAWMALSLAPHLNRCAVHLPIMSPRLMTKAFSTSTYSTWLNLQYVKVEWQHNERRHLRISLGSNVPKLRLWHLVPTQPSQEQFAQYVKRSAVMVFFSCNQCLQPTHSWLSLILQALCRLFECSMHSCLHKHFWISKCFPVNMVYCQ